MATVTFDPLPAARGLQDAGFEAEQAEVIIDTIRRAGSDAATRADLADLRADLYRALWIHSGATIAGTVGLVSLVIAVADALG